MRPAAGSSNPVGVAYRFFRAQLASCDDPDDTADEQLAMQQDPGTVKGVLTVLDSWTAMGGTLQYGQAGQTSCFLMARDKIHPQGSIWPVALYPLRSCEVVFQHLSNRAPFDDIELREELRQRLSKIPGVDLPASKISLMPAFPLARLADPAALELFIETLDWFQHEAPRPDPGAGLVEQPFKGRLLQRPQDTLTRP